MNAIVYLSRSVESEIRQLIHSIHLVAENILPWSPADIFVFHESGFDKALLMSDDVVRRCGVRFVEVDFSGVRPELENLSANQRGYRHMCHFFANDIFWTPELSAYEYQMRLDVDSYILSPVRFNIFAMMKRNGVRYVYRMIMKEKKSVADGLLEASERFFRDHPEFDRLDRPLRAVKLYYTNFEICDRKWFRGDAWQKYFRAIDAAGGIYEHRWGDAPIRWIGLRHMLSRKETFCLRQMAYFHAFKLERHLTFRLPWEYARYVLQVLVFMFKNRKRRS